MPDQPKKLKTNLPSIIIYNNLNPQFPFYRETQKTVITRNIYVKLLCFKEKANQAWKNSTGNSNSVIGLWFWGLLACPKLYCELYRHYTSNIPKIFHVWTVSWVLLQSYAHWTTSMFQSLRHYWSATIPVRAEVLEIRLPEELDVSYPGCGRRTTLRKAENISKKIYFQRAR